MYTGLLNTASKINYRPKRLTVGCQTMKNIQITCIFGLSELLSRIVVFENLSRISVQTKGFLFVCSNLDQFLCFNFRVQSICPDLESSWTDYSFYLNEIFFCSFFLFGLTHLYIIHSYPFQKIEQLSLLLHLLYRLLTLTICF